LRQLNPNPAGFEVSRVVVAMVISFALRREPVKSVNFYFTAVQPRRQDGWPGLKDACSLYNNAKLL
jgi:hypothetical protein